MVYFVPRRYKCEDCGYEISISQSYPAPFKTKDGYLCLECITQFLLKHVKVMKDVGIDNNVTLSEL